MSNILRVVSVSGGKDSTALYLWAMDQWGKDGFKAVFADTGHEHPVTYNYLRNLPEMAQGPEIAWVKGDFKEKIKARVENPARDGAHPLTVAMVDRNKERLRDAGYTFNNTFLDMCFSRSQIPRARRQFCTEELKLKPMREWVRARQAETLYADVILYNGIRAGESERRSKMSEIEDNEFFDCTVMRPLLRWSEQDVFDFLKKKNVPPNPLYTDGGAARVGCYPCIHSRKSELASLPDWAWGRLKEYEDALGISWFAKGTVPGVEIPTIEEAREWARTSRGGRQFDMFTEDAKDVPTCMSTWGICE